MTNDLKWNSCNNSRNKVHNECHVLELSPNPLSTEAVEKPSSLKLVPSSEEAGTAAAVLLLLCYI